MGADDAQQGPPRAGRARTARDWVWLAVVWGRVLVGLALATTGGVVFGHAWTTAYSPWWWVGAITLLTGLLLVLSAIYARSRPEGSAVPKLTLPEKPADDPGPTVPLLGALLVYKYQFISQQQLNRALEEQRKQRKDKRLLGELLVESRLITAAQLREVLDFQHSIAEKRRRRS